MLKLSAAGFALVISTAFAADAQQSTGYEYVGKIVCGPQPDSMSQAIVRGFYATTINVRNPGPAFAIFRKQVIWTLPPGNEKPVKPVTAAMDSLGPTLGFATECLELLKRTNTPPSFHEGLVVITTDVPLDVIGVYTAAPVVRVGRSWGARQVATIHIDRFPPRALTPR